MKIEGQIPHSGPLADRISASKTPTLNGGKSFSAALQKAKDITEVSLAPALKPTPDGPPASAHEITPDDYLSTVKFRMQSGYYNSKSINEALSEKLTGFFDELS